MTNSTSYADKDFYELAVRRGIIPKSLIADLDPVSVGDAAKSQKFLKYNSTMLNGFVTTEQISQLSAEQLSVLLSETELDLQSLQGVWIEIYAKLSNGDRIDEAWVRRVRVKMGCVERFRDKVRNEIDFREQKFNRIRKTFVDLLVQNYGREPIMRLMEAAADPSPRPRPHAVA